MTKLPCVPSNISVNGSDHAEYTRKSRFTEDESKRHENNKGSCQRRLDAIEAPLKIFSLYK